MSSTDRAREDLARAYESLKRRDRLHTLAGRLAKVGAWSFDVEAGESEFTDAVYLMYEVDRIGRRS